MADFRRSGHAEEYFLSFDRRRLVVRANSIVGIDEVVSILLIDPFDR